MIHYNKATDFILEHGSPIEKARLKSILYAEKPNQEVLDSLSKSQNTDGGFPYLRKIGNPSTLSDTSYILTWLYDLNLLEHSISVNALHFILSMQTSEGYWDENSSILRFGPPIWMRPGVGDCILYNSAYALFWLLLSGFEDYDSIAKGYEFLLKAQTSNGTFSGFVHNTWLGIAVFGLVEGWDSTRVEKGLHYLDSFAKSRWSTSQISWMLWVFAVAKIPHEYGFVQKMLDELMGRQRLDGSFMAEDGIKNVINATIEAIKVFKLYNIIV